MRAIVAAGRVDVSATALALAEAIRSPWVTVTCPDVDSGDTGQPPLSSDDDACCQELGCLFAPCAYGCGCTTVASAVPSLAFLPIALSFARRRRASR